MRPGDHPQASNLMRDAAGAHPGEQFLHRHVEAFAPSFRPAVREVMQIGPAVADLASSFPALLFALATGYGTDGARRSALAAVLAGLPLREAASRLALPFWLRKLPPPAFQHPLAAPPADPGLVNRLVSLVPPQPASAAAWLDRVLITHRTGRADLTVWVAQQYRAALPAGASESFLGVLAWAWYSGAAPEHRGTQLVTTRWSPTLGVQRSAKEAVLWKERIALDVCLGPGLCDAWLSEGAVGGYAFVALRTANDFIAEALAMDNCLDRFADRLEDRTVRVFSVRRDGQSVADVEIAPHDREPGHPAIAQLRGPRNRRAPIEIWQATYSWLGQQQLRLAEPRHHIRTGKITRQKRRNHIWGPFLDVLPAHARAALEQSSLIGHPPQAPRRGTAPSPIAVPRRRSSPATEQR